LAVPGRRPANQRSLHDCEHIARAAFEDEAEGAVGLEYRRLDGLDQLLEQGSKIVGSSQLASGYAEHLEHAWHERLINERLQARDASPSRIKDAALALGALSWGAFFGAQPDTPAKLAGFSYAFEHLEIAAYELLSRVANRAGDTETEAVSRRILQQERAAAKPVHDLFGAALAAVLDEHAVGPRSRKRCCPSAGG
jgi:ferritin-like metal-binding protein YciE